MKTGTTSNNEKTSNAWQKLQLGQGPNHKPDFKTTQINGTEESGRDV